MVEAVVYSQEGKERGKFVLSDALFGIPMNEPLVYEYVKNFLANQRQGTSKTKTRAEVSGGTKKPWRQKGTGRARSGDNSSPIWVRGGKAFGPVPRDYYSLLPVKKRRGALICALSAKAKDKKVYVLEDFTISEPKTKVVVSLLRSMALTGRKNLFIVDAFDKNLFLAVRNIKNTNILKVSQVNAYEVLNAENVLITKKALEAVKAKFESAEGV